MRVQINGSLLIAERHTYLQSSEIDIEVFADLVIAIESKNEYIPINSLDEVDDRFETTTEYAKTLVHVPKSILQIHFISRSYASF